MISKGIISTIEDRCRNCYSCIRECPAKAIRVEDDQAMVISEMCIACAHCVKVCSQNAKQVAAALDDVLKFNEIKNFLHAKGIAFEKGEIARLKVCIVWELLSKLNYLNILFHNSKM